MDAKNYFKNSGKRTQALHIPCDGVTKQIEVQAKAKGFDFNAWVRDLIGPKLHEVTEACGIKVE